jgi:ribosomal protein L24
MAYRKLELTDKVRITDGSDNHGQEGEVVAVTHAGTQAQVQFFSRTFSHTTQKWFSQKNLAILASTPVKATPIKEKEMLTGKFKVGDRVKVIDAGDGFAHSALGKHGTIRRTDSTSLPVLVDFDDGDNDWGTFEELAHEGDVPSVIDVDAINAKLKQIDRLSAEIKELLA